MGKEFFIVWNENSQDNSLDHTNILAMDECSPSYNWLSTLINIFFPHISSATDEKKRKSKWDAQPMGLQQQGLRQGSTAPAGVVNLTTSATGTKATVISAVGTLSKKSSSGSVSSSSNAKWMLHWNSISLWVLWT